MKQNEGRRWLPTALYVLVLGIGLQTTVSSQAGAPENAVNDPALHRWFDSLKQPGTNKLCCSISDCRFTDYKLNDGHYEIIIDGWRHVVPDGAVLRTTENPTGHAVVCKKYVDFGLPLALGEVRTGPQDTIEILCFIPERANT